MATKTLVRPRSDKELIALIVRGRDSAFIELHKRYELKMMRFAMILVSEEADAEDVVQEAFIRISRNSHRYNGVHEVHTWIYTIVKRLCFNFLRNRKRRRILCYADLLPRDAEGLNRERNWSDAAIGLDALDPKADVYSRYEREEFERKLVLALGDISEHHKEAFELRMFAGKTYLEIAAMLELNLGTVKSRLHRAKADLRTRLDRHHFDN